MYELQVLLDHHNNQFVGTKEYCVNIYDSIVNSMNNKSNTSVIQIRVSKPNEDIDLFSFMTGKFVGMTLFKQK